MASADVARQGLEERCCVGGLSPEDVLVPTIIFPVAQLLGDDGGKGLENALLAEVPAGVLRLEEYDEVVDASVLGGPDAGRPGCLLTGFLW